MISEPRARQTTEMGAFILGFLGAYLATTAVPTPLAWYFPTEHRWALAVHPQGLAADFYGRVLVSLVAGAVFLAVARGLRKPLGDLAPMRRFTILIVWNGAMFTFAAGLFIYLLMGRESYPAPLPPGYVPR